MPALHSQIPPIVPEAPPLGIAELVGDLAPLWWFVVAFGLVALLGSFAMRDRGYGPPDVQFGNISLNARVLACVSGGLVVVAALLLIYGE